MASGMTVTVEFPAQRPGTRSFDVFFDLRLNKQLFKTNIEAGDLRRHRVYYDVTVMKVGYWVMPVYEKYMLVSALIIYLFQQ